MRRVLQVTLLIGLWPALAALAIAMIAEGFLIAAIGLGLLVLVGVWAVDAFVPTLGRAAVRRGPPSPPHAAPRVALTFDDGPSPDTPAVLRALRDAGVRATFFMLGRHVELHREIAASVVEAGHAVGNHTYSHRSLALASPKTIDAEIDRAEGVLVGLRGFTPLFRAPRGFQGPLVRASLRRRGLRLIGWTRGAWDSEPRSAAAIAMAAIGKPRDGDILLLHDGAGTSGYVRRDQTAAAIPAIVAAYRARGFRFVTVPEMLGERAAG
jgi:peptidoglycan/xylan/chitin deacetylase (PgdA/CDA1 family)